MTAGEEHGKENGAERRNLRSADMGRRLNIQLFHIKSYKPVGYKTKIQMQVKLLSLGLGGMQCCGLLNQNSTAPKEKRVGGVYWVRAHL